MADATMEMTRGRQRAIMFLGLHLSDASPQAGPEPETTWQILRSSILVSGGVELDS